MEDLQPVYSTRLVHEVWQQLGWSLYQCSEHFMRQDSSKCCLAKGRSPACRLNRPSSWTVTAMLVSSLSPCSERSIRKDSSKCCLATARSPACRLSRPSPWSVVAMSEWSWPQWGSCSSNKECMNCCILAFITHPTVPRQVQSICLPLGHCLHHADIVMREAENRQDDLAAAAQGMISAIRKVEKLLEPQVEHQPIISDSSSSPSDLPEPGVDVNVVDLLGVVHLLFAATLHELGVLSTQAGDRCG